MYAGKYPCIQILSVLKYDRIFPYYPGRGDNASLPGVNGSDYSGGDRDIHRLHDRGRDRGTRGVVLYRVPWERVITVLLATVVMLTTSCPVPLPRIAGPTTSPAVGAVKVVALK